MTHRVHGQSHAAVNFDDAIAVLAGDPERLLQDATDVSAAHARTAGGNLHVRLGRLGLGREIQVELGEFDPVEVRRSVVPIRWRATHGHVWFPTMDAQLEVESVTIRPPLVRVSLVGGYTPPLGPLGEAIDAVAAHRIAEATTQRFIDEVTRRLEELVGAPGTIAG